MKISVVTVVYNGGDTIERTINSVIDQSGVDVEYIIVDGGSLDQTMDIVRKYRDKILHIISEPDNGVYDAMNKGLKLVTGDIVAFLNSDDWYEADVLKYVANAFESRRVDILCANARIIGEYGERVRKAELDKKKIIRQLPASHQAIFATRKWFDKIGEFDTNYLVAADYEWVTRSLLGGCRIDVFPMLVVNFSLGGMSSKYDEICQKEIKNIALKYYSGTSLESDMMRYYMYEELLHKSRDEGEGFWEGVKVDIPKEKKIYIFGAGKDGMKCYKLLENLQYTVIGFIDNHIIDSQVKSVNKTIQLPETLLVGRDFVVIASTRYKDDMQKQLKKQGFRENFDFCIYEDIRDKVIFAC